jgi:hypothetical protein
MTFYPEGLLIPDGLVVDLVHQQSYRSIRIGLKRELPGPVNAPKCR